MKESSNQQKPKKEHPRIQKVLDWFKKVWEWKKKVIIAAYKWVKQALIVAWGWIKRTAKTIGTWLKPRLIKFFQWIKHGFKAIITWFKFEFIILNEKLKSKKQRAREESKEDITSNNAIAEIEAKEKEARKLNVLAIDRMQRSLDQLKDILKSGKRRKILFIRLGLYIIQFVLIIWFLTLIPNPWIALILSVLLSYTMTLGIDFIMKKLEVRDHIGEVTKDSFKLLVQSVISSFPIMPSILQDNLVYFVTEGKLMHQSYQLAQLKAYKNTMEIFLEGRRAYKNGKKELAQALMQRVIRRAQQGKFSDLLSEAKIFADSLH